MQVRNTKYVTPNRQATFTFDFIQLPDLTWRVYIVTQPPYRGRAEGSVVSHRLRDLDGRSYICWSAPIRTLNAAKGVARAWADATEEYVRTGRFPAPGPARTVTDVSSSAHVSWADQEGAVGPTQPARPPPSGPAPAPTPAALPTPTPTAPPAPPSQSPFARLAAARRHVRDRRTQ